jgi:DNA-binding MarR family transcriptional regulator
VADDLGERAAAALGELLLRRTRSHLYAGLTEAVAPGLDAGTYPVLSGLARVGPCSAARLAGQIGLDRSGTSRHASRLEAADLLERRPDPNDARATLLILTPPGLAAVAAIRRRLAERVGDQLAGWPAGEAAVFVAGLERLAGEWLTPSGS